MQYIEPRDARHMSGMRLALSKGGAPGPWSEAAKKIFEYKNIPYVPVAQRAGKGNEDLAEWTGFRNAPVAVWNDGVPKAHVADILMLAERIVPTPALVPSASDDRVTVLGICAELAGEGGFGWSRRLMMIGNRADEPDVTERAQTMRRAYGDAPEQIAAAPQRCVDILDMLARRLHAQRAAGSRYLVGQGYTAADIFWACFSQMLVPLPIEDQPNLHPAIQASYGKIGDFLASRYDPIVLEHRDFVFREHIGLPLDY